MTFDQISNELKVEVENRTNNGTYWVGVTEVEADVEDFEKLWPMIEPHAKDLTMGNIADVLMQAWGWVLDEDVYMKDYWLENAQNELEVAKEDLEEANAKLELDDAGEDELNAVLLAEENLEDAKSEVKNWEFEVANFNEDAVLAGFVDEALIAFDLKKKKVEKKVKEKDDERRLLGSDWYVRRNGIWVKE
jgi:hypothetical protein